MKTSALRIGIAGCGLAARIHLERLLALKGVAIVGCADPDLSAAEALSDRASIGVASGAGGAPVPAFTDHRELLRRVAPDALAIFSPHLSHYRQSMDALQAGCHVFIEKPLSTNLQEAADIVSLARARNLKVGVGHQFRLCPSLVEARHRIAEGVIGPLRLVTCILARPWLSTLGEDEKTWRRSATLAAGGILADAGDHLIDALLWTTGQVALEVGAIQNQSGPGVDLVTAAAIRFADGTPVSFAISGISPGKLFTLDYFGELGRLHVTDQTLEEERLDTPRRDVALPSAGQTIDGNFVAALTNGASLCCPADQALDTVRLLEAIARVPPRPDKSFDSFSRRIRELERRAWVTPGCGSSALRDAREIASLRGGGWFAVWRGSRPRQESLKVSRPACRRFRLAGGLNVIRLHDFNHSGTPTECVP